MDERVRQIEAAARRQIVHITCGDLEIIIISSVSSFSNFILQREKDIGARERGVEKRQQPVDL